MAVAAVIVFAASLTGTSHPGQHWVVATRSLAPGSVLEPGDLTTSTMRLSPATAALAYRQAASVEGRALAVGLRAGELLQDSMLVPSSQKPVLRPVSLAVDPVSLEGLYPGQPVDVLMTQGTGNAAGVTVVVRNATLFDVVTSSSNVLAPGTSGQVSLGVSTLSEVEDVVAAAHTGTVTLVAAERSDGAGPGPDGSAPAGSGRLLHRPAPPPPAPPPPAPARDPPRHDRPAMKASRATTGGRWTGAAEARAMGQHRV